MVVGDGDNDSAGSLWFWLVVVGRCFLEVVLIAGGDYDGGGIG